MKLKGILVLSGLAAVSFAASLGVSMFVIKSPQSKVASDANAVAPVATAHVAEVKLTSKESQLDDLIRELRQKLAECKQREQNLEEREGRLELAQEMLKKQSKELEDLRIALLAPLNGLKEEQDRLDKSRVRVLQEEQVNLKKAAAVYEKMDASSGSKILSSMCEGQQEEDVVKILHYMSERSAAKIFSEMTDKTLAGRLTEKLKRIREDS